MRGITTVRGGHAATNPLCLKLLQETELLSQ